jgi:hypothetical protein
MVITYPIHLMGRFACARGWESVADEGQCGAAGEAAGGDHGAEVGYGAAGIMAQLGWLFERR